MKNIINKVVCAIALVSMLSSCSKDFEKINTDPNALPNALPQQLMAPALVNSLTYNLIRNRNFNNELMQVTVDQSDGEGRVFRYDHRPGLSDYQYNGLYSELTNFKDMYKIASEPLNYNTSYKGISLICQSWIYAILTDTYGDIPFSQSNLARDSGIYEPKFDAQRDIYAGIFQNLERANSLLDSNTAILGSADPVFNGSISKWRKLGNSLYLRLLMRVSGKAEVAALAISKIKDIVETNAAEYPIMTSNDDDAILKWTGVGPLISPLNTVREQDYRFPAIASFFIDNLVIWNDPRQDISLGVSNINRWGIAPYQGSFLGVQSGYLPGTEPIKKSYFYSNTSATSLQKDPLTGIIMTYAELKFILCEAAAKGWIASSAESHYKAAVQASIKQWMPTWAVPIDTYLASADIPWPAAGTLSEQMEQLHLLKYYALFMVDNQQWFEYRRTGYPTLPIGPGVQNGGVMPARMQYPVYVQSTNPTNYQIAIAAQGPDKMNTLVWWQKP
ncbi:MAG TPA: SusD/RagB family nutrient-binding outer membrane lipoprotein [Ferruginibacter sp.]|nr:SusD/RagB family nutrient-binding outer membrane lipoprotein [Ferruginibacter sp.]HRE65004.1 SusD/RagB family nutrient-binding outer membrane lipoprotein [Ferruginibacter sp.]